MTVPLVEFYNVIFFLLLRHEILVSGRKLIVLLWWKVSVETKHALWLSWSPWLYELPMTITFFTNIVLCVLFECIFNILSHSQEMQSDHIYDLASDTGHIRWKIAFRWNELSCIKKYSQKHKMRTFSMFCCEYFFSKMLKMCLKASSLNFYQYV